MRVIKMCVERRKGRDKIVKNETWKSSRAENAFHVFGVFVNNLWCACKH